MRTKRNVEFYLPADMFKSYMLRVRIWLHNAVDALVAREMHDALEQDVVPAKDCPSRPTRVSIDGSG